ncbi:Dyp-type peroxidase [Nakamurella aerolata]|uniref:Dyp-type peroxidase n=1 Tax=Nakamurella aerolata TaxID=1656892 RepID=UPI0031B5CB4F
MADPHHSDRGPAATTSVVTRRGLLAGGAALVGGAAVGGGIVAGRASIPQHPPAAHPAAAPPPADGQRTAAGTSPAASSPPAGSNGSSGADARRTVPFAGAHQAGVVTPAQTYASFCAFDLRSGAGRDGLRRLLMLVTDDIRRMTAGQAALADTAPELATDPARLTVTVGFGPQLFDKIGRPGHRPAGFAELPAFAKIDKLQKAYSGGDLLLKIAADDAMMVAHAQRMVSKDVRAFATPRWSQRGFLGGPGGGDANATGRNLMGQVDGTVNPRTDAEYDELVWSAEPGRFAGGTTMVVRRIRMELDLWDELDRSAMETSIGRKLDSGAPLTGTSEFDEPDFDKLDATGLPAIAPFSHIRLARGDGSAPQILRRPYNYDDSPGPGGASDLGQIFCSFQARLDKQFVPMQQRLADGDLFNTWITPIGSAVFAVPPGCEDTADATAAGSDYLGRELVT